MYSLHGNLTDDEFKEIASLDYILTWEYSDDFDKDLKRYKELSKKKYNDNKI